MAKLSEIEIAISQRVKYCFEYFEYHKIKAGKSRFSEELGIDKANLSKYIALERPFPVEALVNLINKKDLNGHWIMTGKGNMFNNYSSHELEINETKVTYTISEEELKQSENGEDIYKILARKILKGIPLPPLVMIQVLNEEFDKNAVAKHLNPKSKALKKESALLLPTSYVLVRELKTGKLFIYKDSPEVSLYEYNPEQVLSCYPVNDSGVAEDLNAAPVLIKRKDCEYESWSIFYKGPPL